MGQTVTSPMYMLNQWLMLQYLGLHLILVKKPISIAMLKFHIVRLDTFLEMTLLFLWPPRSPDLMPCDFFLWAYVKDHVFLPHLPRDITQLQEMIIHVVTGRRGFRGGARGPRPPPADHTTIIKFSGPVLKYFLHSFSIVQ